jgi:hypothetical protein
MEARRWATFEDMAGVTLNFGPGELSFPDLINGWSAEVLKFYGELDVNWHDPDPGIWGVDDLVGSYYRRSAIESGLDLLEGATGFRNVAPLIATDELLRSFTIEDDDSRLLAFSGERAPDSGRWWRRLPVRGPVAQQLAESWESSGVNVPNSSD